MNYRFTHVLFFLMVAAAIPVSASRHALLIGCNDGGTEVDPLRWAESDATKFSSLLNNIGGFDRTSVTTLLAPDSAAIGAGPPGPPPKKG
jgi:hypothetical protein